MTTFSGQRWGKRPETRGEAFKRGERRPNGMAAVRILPGGYYVTTRADEMLVTVLGSCVAACVRDPLTGAAGMNHFMLPQNPHAALDTNSDTMRFGNHAMEVLINEMLLTGCPRERMEIKVFGGADLITGGLTNSGIGTDNAAFVTEYLAREGMSVAAEHLGGSQPRKVHFYPGTGKVRMLLLDKPEAVAADEERYRATLRRTPPDGDVELF